MCSNTHTHTHRGREREGRQRVSVNSWFNEYNELAQQNMRRKSLGFIYQIVGSFYVSAVVNVARATTNANGCF